MSAVPSELAPGTDIGPWRVIALSGRGRSGAVYRVCLRPWPNFVAALKILHGPTARTSVPDFTAEGELVRSQPLPSRMIRFFGSGMWRGHPWYAMEWGEPLPENPSVPVAASCVRRLAISLALFARKGNVHGDVRPSNIRLVNGLPVLIDFGCSVLQRRLVFDPKIGRLRWVREKLFGSLYYMAPELLSLGVVPSFHSDLFALAMSLPRICGTSFPAFEEFYRIATNHDPARRPQDIREWLALLDKCLADYERRNAVLSPREKFLVAARKFARVAKVVFCTVIALWMLSVGAKWAFSVVSKTIMKLRPEDVIKLRDEGIALLDKGDVTNAVIYLTPAAVLGDETAEQWMRRIRKERKAARNKCR